MFGVEETDHFDEVEYIPEEIIENIENYFQKQYEEDEKQEKTHGRKKQLAYKTRSVEQRKNSVFNKYELKLRGLRYSWGKSKSNIKLYGLKHYEEKYNRLVNGLEDYAEYAKKIDNYKKINEIYREIKETKSFHKKFLNDLNPNVVTINDAKNMRKKISVQGTIKRKGKVRTVKMKDGSTSQVCDVDLVDNSGKINVNLWNEDISKVKVGSIIKIANGYTTEYGNELILNTGKIGRLIVLEY